MIFFPSHLLGYSVYLYTVYINCMCKHVCMWGTCLCACLFICVWTLVCKCLCTCMYGQVDTEVNIRCLPESLSMQGGSEPRAHSQLLAQILSSVPSPPSFYVYLGPHDCVARACSPHWFISLVTHSPTFVISHYEAVTSTLYVVQAASHLHQSSCLSFLNVGNRTVSLRREWWRPAIWKDMVMKYSHNSSLFYC